MKTKLSSNNPFLHDRYGFLWEHLSRIRSRFHLDYGTHDGATLITLHDTGVLTRSLGVDLISNEHFDELPGGMSLLRIEKSSGLESIEPETFQTASLLDVLEHIADQRTLLTELHRVLVPEGYLFVTVPRQHLLSFLDIGNLKFRFPKLHRVYYELAHGKVAYRVRYVECEDGLFGDIEVEKMWHQHFRNQELTELLEDCGFQVELIDGSGLLFRIIRAFCFVPLFGPLFEKVLDFDQKLFESANLFCIATKKS